MTMPSVINLTEASLDQLRAFFDSFDIILSDCDGVIWYLEKPIPEAMKAVTMLQNIGKNLYLVTNNGTIRFNRYCEKMRQNGLDIKPDQVINSSKVISWYLKKIQFTGEAFVIGSAALQERLIEDGITVMRGPPKVYDDDVTGTLRAVQDQPSIKAVIVDFCPFFDWPKLALAITCLQRKDVLYICGAQDEWVVHGLNKKVIGPGPLISIITKYSGRTPIECAKPSEILRDYIMDTLDVKDPKRCLFIGDTINYDMKFGTMCGFQKLFVSTGLDSIENATLNESTRPDFYVPSLELLQPIINSLYNSTNGKGEN
ncbi:glycerol-3-phosphate phosphatase-like [Ceratina calcarata]|uniref:Glycerol-3-phosphate phosphatase-like n=1 Tax=Ceratina calcarata TaxID=156304 RepID=A0AAJ7JGY6_9HYME|nr:glycerol-3-phosphate phosphatase-like [Ceratina calcarata]